VFDQKGRQIDKITIPNERWTANVSFCARDKRTLFITASKGLYRIKMRVKGANDAK
jgi:gluconolactonase